MIFARHMNYSLDIGLFLRANANGSSMRLCLMHVVMSLYLIGLV